MTHDYEALRAEVLAASTRALELAAQIEEQDAITAHNLRLMALYGGKVAKSTRLRIEDLATGGEQER